MGEALEPPEFRYDTGSRFGDPAEVLGDGNLSRGEKRQLLEDWRFRIEARLARGGSSEILRKRSQTLAKALETLDHTQH